VHVVGRTRWLKVPYRNTYEIYRAAYSMIANYAEIQKLLSEEGEVVEPELSSQAMRHGTRALFQKCRNDADELQYIKNTIAGLRQEGYPESQIVVLVRYRRDLEAIQTALRGSGVEVKNIHGYKGLEVEAVILPHLENTFSFAEDEAQERRLLYMAMSRARSRLYLTYSGKLPAAYEEIRRQGLADFIE
jgi:superfamily I DNA/RNA helicase